MRTQPGQLEAGPGGCRWVTAFCEIGLGIMRRLEVAHDVERALVVPQWCSLTC